MMTEISTQNSFFAGILAAIDAPATQEPEQASLTQTLNQFIERGISFDVGDEAFTVCPSDLLTETEMQFIETNQLAIICTLQQALLARHVFSNAADNVEIFGNQIAWSELEGRTYFDAVREVSQRWFKHLLTKEA